MSSRPEDVPFKFSTKSVCRIDSIQRPVRIQQLAFVGPANLFLKNLRKYTSAFSNLHSQTKNLTCQTHWCEHRQTYNEPSTRSTHARHEQFSPRQQWGDRMKAWSSAMRKEKQVYLELLAITDRNGHLDASMIDWSDGEHGCMVFWIEQNYYWWYYQLTNP